MLEFFGKRLGYMQEVQREERGFTHIELLVVVAIIGVLVAIALPVFLGQRAKAEDARAQANVREAATAINVFYTENDAAPTVAPGSPYPDAGVPLAGSGFSGSNPDVRLVATGTAATANWCVSTPGSGRTIGGVAANFWFQTETGGTPEHAAALPADC